VNPDDISLEIFCKHGQWFWVARWRYNHNDFQAKGQAATAEQCVRDAMETIKETEG